MPTIFNHLVNNADADEIWTVDGVWGAFRIRSNVIRASTPIPPKVCLETVLAEMFGNDAIGVCGRDINN